MLKTSYEYHKKEDETIIEQACQIGNISSSSDVVLSLLLQTDCVYLDLVSCNAKDCFQQYRCDAVLR